LALIDKYTGPWGHNQVKHYLKRIMFGASYEQIDYFVKNGMNYTLNETLKLDFSPITEPNNYYNDYNPDKDVPKGKTWVNAPYSQSHNEDRKHSFTRWWHDRLVNSNPTITEKLILFWHNHFGVAHSMTIDARSNYQYYKLLQKYALGDFKELVKGMTVNPLMLQFLNGYENTSRLPDENYARELFELFTLGKGPESKYTEKDVQEAAKVLTGFLHDYQANGPAFFHTRHNADDKVFSNFFGNKKIVAIGPSHSWQLEVWPLIDMIFEKEEVSKHICRKIYRFFVHYDITQTIENEIITPLAEIFRKSNYVVEPVLRTLFESNHFYDENLVIGAMIKSPADYYFGLLKELKITLPENIALRNDYLDYIQINMDKMLQNIPNPPNVAGWQAYYLYPIFNKTWINGETLKIRGLVLDALIEKEKLEDHLPNNLDLTKTIENIPNAEDPNKLIDNLLSFTFSFEPNVQLKVELKKILLSNQTDDSYWTQAWLEFKAEPTNITKKQIIVTRLKQLFLSIMRKSEYSLH
jgi:uncharacterized protein (DUF1800 family)